MSDVDSREMERKNHSLCIRNVLITDVRDLLIIINRSQTESQSDRIVRYLFLSSVFKYLLDSTH